MPKAKDCLESNKQDDYQIRYSLLLVARICSYYSNGEGGGYKHLELQLLLDPVYVLGWTTHSYDWYLTLGI